ncbi:hypothetical protein BT96DRAFT_1026658 [Gymnopus androsaceus JB14]|uniref:Polyketide synthase-like phosphopantetheine-binding domain-containing protein n=1 Tax=Gymnopus androsaceus JB14 TaxID=1447944 RepID=A0A6A4GIK4_9AGAR|nr:hypothetical protein BT96DRAFT_1026658 [Gymnopus androsaceus JB14]
MTCPSQDAHVYTIHFPQQRLCAHVQSYPSPSSTITADYVIIFETQSANLYSGGPLPPRIAESLISRGVVIASMYGGTEFGVVTKLRMDTNTWQYFEFVKGINLRWVAQADGTYEAQFLTSETHHVAIENLPDVSGYSTSDLFEPHPTIPNLWKIVGRIDDVIIHSSGEKTVPAPMEAIITANPIVSGAIIFGRQRDQPGILLEPLPAYQVDVNDSAQVSKFRNLIWPTIEEANKVAPAFSRIFKEMILVVDPEKPLPRVGKGTVARKAALTLYSSEIDKLYETVESNSGGDSVEPPKSWEVADLQSWLIGQISDILSTEAPGITEDLFEHGVDSLSATILRLRLVGALRKSNFAVLAATITQGIVYSYPTIGMLVDVLAKLVNGSTGALNVSKTHEESMEEMISKYSQGLDASLPDPIQASTGNLGAQLLQSLLLNDSVARVYTLNRPSTRITMYERHRARFQDKGLDISLLSSPKLVYLSGETSHEDLSLPEDTLKELRQNLTVIIHNAWRLDFNLSLASFESHVKGSRVLIDLARSSRHSSSIRFLFTSSIASAQSWDAKTQGLYPEEVVMDAKYAVGGGYGESKYVTERILAKSGLEATSFRLGQLTGGPKRIGTLPMLLGSHSCERCTTRDRCHGLPLSRALEWVDAVEQHARNPTEKDTTNIPAVKLIDFYRLQSNVDDTLRNSGQSTFESAGLTPLRTTNVEKLSECMRTLQPLDETIIKKWVRYWIDAGF